MIKNYDSQYKNIKNSCRKGCSMISESQYSEYTFSRSHYPKFQYPELDIFQYPERHYPKSQFPEFLKCPICLCYTNKKYNILFEK